MNSNTQEPTFKQKRDRPRLKLRKALKTTCQEMIETVCMSNISPIESLRRKKVAENIANMQELSKKSKYDTIEIKGGVLEQERIERRNKKISDRR